MNTLAEQVELLKQWYPLETFDQERPNETAHEKKLTGFLYVALARIEELEQANARLKRNAANRAPEPVGKPMEESPVTAHAPVGDDDPPVPGAPERIYRGSHMRWRQICDPAPFNKYRRDRDTQDDVAEPMEG